MHGMSCDMYWYDYWYMSHMYCVCKQKPKNKKKKNNWENTLKSQQIV